MLPWLEESDHPRKVAIIGDIIFDEYLGGEIHRISPEAPVPVHLVSKQSFSAGGSANAARNIALCGGSASLFGVWGSDEAARLLQELLRQDNIDIAGVFEDTNRPTIKKTRIVAGQQQIVRVDWESILPLSSDHHDGILAKLERSTFDAILISDYGKGCLQASLIAGIVSIAKAKNIPVVVDPKGIDYSRYAGCDLITPNTAEVKLALGLEHAASSAQNSDENLGRLLQERFKLSGVLVTMGSRGMIYTPPGESDQPLIRRQPRAREVFDVSGAGDTVAALITLALGSGCDIDAAMNYANIGAGLVVEKSGTQPVRRAELERALLESHDAKHAYCTRSKVCSLDGGMERIKIERQKGNKIVFTNGCFDLLHGGHISYLEEARALGDFLVIGVNSDDSVRRLKGSSRPIINERERMHLLASLACVDCVISFDQDTPLELIQLILPDFLVKAADYENQYIVGSKEVEDHGGRVQCLPFVAGRSTSSIIERIQKMSV